MDRRTVTIGLVAAFASPAFAQQNNQQRPAPAETQPNQNLRGNRNAGAPANQGGGQRSQADAEHIDRTLALGTLAHQAATFARDKAQHARVKLFATFEEAEQTTMAEVLRSLADPATTSSTGATQAASTAPVMSNESSAKMEQMSKAQPGPAFDRDFVALQLQGHKDLLQVQERYLSTNPGNRPQAAIAKLARNQIKEHIAMLEEIQKELR